MFANAIRWQLQRIDHLAREAEAVLSAAQGDTLPALESAQLIVGLHELGERLDSLLDNFSSAVDPDLVGKAYATAENLEPEF